MTDEEAIAAVRSELSRRFIFGHGLEIGAGARPFPIPAGAQVSYGDMRDRASLESYFKTNAVQSGEPIDAQTLAGIADASFDFVISAHVIEHLRHPNRRNRQRHSGPQARRDPSIGRARDAANFRSRPAGNQRCTCARRFSRRRHRHLPGRLRGAFALCASDPYRPALLRSGNSTAGDRSGQALAKVRRSFPCLDSSRIRGLLDAASDLVPFQLIETASVVNENLFVLRKILAIDLRIRRTWRRITTTQHNRWKKMD